VPPVSMPIQRFPIGGVSGNCGAEVRPAHVVVNPKLVGRSIGDQARTTLPMSEHTIMGEK
jgi:hypothetical protein